MKRLLLALAVAVAVVGCSKPVEPQKPVAVAPPVVVAPAPEVAVAPVSPVATPSPVVAAVAPIVPQAAPTAKVAVTAKKGEVTKPAAKPAKVAKKVCKGAVVTSTRYPDVSFAYDCVMGKGGANQALAVKILAKADANLKAPAKKSSFNPECRTRCMNETAGGFGELGEWLMPTVC